MVSLGPSRIAIPDPQPGWRRSWEDHFDTLDASKWWTWNGTAGGGYDCDYNPAQVNVFNSILALGVRWSPSAQRWHSGGVGRQDAVTYAHWTWASRMTGTKSMNAEDADLGWPVVGWPPELDFDESDPGWDAAHRTSGSVTFHWGPTNQQEADTFAGIDMTAWHLFEGIWVAGSMSFLVDGTQVAQIANPNVRSTPMRLVFETLTRGQNPTSDFLAQEIDWATEDVQ